MVVTQVNCTWFVVLYLQQLYESKFYNLEIGLAVNTKELLPKGSKAALSSLFKDQPEEKYPAWKRGAGFDYANNWIQPF